MTWVGASLLAYFLFSVASILDKLLLKKRIANAAVYVFYVAILSLFAVFLVPFGVEVLSWNWVTVSFFAGIVFVYALFYLMKAVKDNEVSRVVSISLVFIQIFTFLIAIFLEGEQLAIGKFTGFLLLLFGGLLISFDLPIKSLKIFAGFKHAFLSGLLLAISYSLFGYIYDEVGFLTGFTWTRIGVFLGGLTLLLNRSFRVDILRTLKGRSVRAKKKRNLFTAFLFLLNKLTTSTGSILMNYSFAIGSVAYVQAMGSAQFVFVLMLAFLASFRRPDIFEEKMHFWDWFQKIISVIIITVGVILISI